MSRFLRFLCIFTGIIFAGSAFAAAGYVCESYREYTSCATGYYMTASASSTTYNGTLDVGNACRPCSVAVLADVPNYYGREDIVPAYCPGGTESPIYEITLEANGGTLATTFNKLYFQPSPRRFCTDAENCAGTTISQLAETQFPTRATTTSGATTTNYTFAGFATDPNLNDGETYIYSDGAVDNSEDYELGYATIWYAQWETTTKTGCPVGHYVKNNVCTPCAAGSYQPNDGYSGTSCTVCTAGTYQPNTGQSACISASAGNYVSGTEATAQTPCEKGTYTPSIKSTSCTACPTSYNTSGTGSTNIRDCQIVCGAGKAVKIPGGQCTQIEKFSTNSVGLFFTQPQHNVKFGDISPVSFCPTAYASGPNSYEQIETCFAENAGAGKQVTATPEIQYIRVRNLMPMTLKIVEIRPLLDENLMPGSETPISYDSTRSTTTSNYILRPGLAADGDYTDTQLIAKNGVIDAQGATVIQRAADYTVKLRNVAPVDAIEIVFMGNSTSSLAVPYAVDISLDGETWTEIYAAESNTTASIMGAQSVPMGLLTKRFVPYGESASPANTYAPARSIRLAPGFSDSYTNLVQDIACSTLNDDTGFGNKWAYSPAGSSTPQECFSGCSKTIANGTTTASTAPIYYPGVCRYSVKCNTGYNGSTGTGIVTETPACTPICQPVVLKKDFASDNTTNATEDDTIIYSKYDDTSTWYGDEGCDSPITTITKPTKSGYVFAGYFGNDSDVSNITGDTTLYHSNMKIAPVTDGNKLGNSGITTLQIPNNDVGKYTPNSTNKVWKARWVKTCESSDSALCLGPYYSNYNVQYVNCCMPGYNKTDMGISTDGTTCPSGT